MGGIEACAVERNAGIVHAEDLVWSNPDERTDRWGECGLQC
jgi:hypothetical protein